MAKLVVAIIFTVMIVGCCIYVMGGKIIPATGTAGTNVSTTIQNAFN
jgi:hypothetical protein